MRIFLILHMVGMLTLFSSAYCRADELEDNCLKYANNSGFCTNVILKKLAIDNELQVKHLRDISVNLKEIAEQLALIREQLEGVKK